MTVVELGDIHTGFTQARQKVIVGDKEYGGRISRSVSQMEKDEQNGANPEVIGAYIAKIAEKKCKPIVWQERSTSSLACSASCCPAVFEEKSLERYTRNSTTVGYTV